MDTRIGPGRDSARGVALQSGAVVEARALRIDGAVGTGLYVSSSSTLVLDDAVVTGVEIGPGARWAQGVLVQDAATLTATGLVVSDVAGPGPYVPANGAATPTGCAVEACTFADAVVTYGTLVIEASDLSGSADTFAAVMAFDTFGASSLSVVDSDLSAGTLAAVWLDGASAQLRDNRFRPGLTRPGDTLHGNAVYATRTTPWDETTGTGVHIGGAGTVFRASAGPSVLLHGGSATFADDLDWKTQGTAWQQACDTVVTPPPGFPANGVLCPEVWGDVNELQWVLYTTEDEIESQE